MKSVVVFCASGVGENPNYKNIAFQVGEFLASRGIRVVYGGAKIGLMGAVADGALSKGGEVIGVLPKFLSGAEIAHDGLTDLILVESMHERKLKMHELSDGIITLPGGFGTFEELFEMLTWAQLGLHQKPIGVLNTAGYYDFLKSMIGHMRNEGLLRAKYHGLMLMHAEISQLFSLMENYIPIEGVLKMNPDQS